MILPKEKVKNNNKSLNCIVCGQWENRWGILCIADFIMKFKYYYDDEIKGLMIKFKEVNNLQFMMEISLCEKNPEASPTI